LRDKLPKGNQMLYTRKAVGSTSHGSFELIVVADNDCKSRFKNGYSNWDGKVVDDGFTVKWFDNNGVYHETWDTIRKNAINNAIAEYCYYKFKPVVPSNKNGKRVKIIQPTDSLEYTLY